MIKLYQMHWSFLLKSLCFEICSGGVYGQLRVYYSTIQLLVDSSIDPLTYFDPPINGTRGVVGQVFSTISSFNPVKVSFLSMHTIPWKKFQFMKANCMDSKFFIGSLKVILLLYVMIKGCVGKGYHWNLKKKLPSWYINESKVVSLYNYWVLWDSILKWFVKLVLLQACAENCLKTPTCLAFEHSFIDNISLCMWYSTQAPPQSITFRNNYQYYSKNAVKVNGNLINMYWTQLTDHLSLWKSSTFMVLLCISFFSMLILKKVNSLGPYFSPLNLPGVKIMSVFYLKSL